MEDSQPFLFDGEPGDRAQSVDKVMQAVLETYGGEEFDLERICVQRTTEGRFEVTVDALRGEASPAIYSWSEGETVELEPPVPYSGASGGGPVA